MRKLNTGLLAGSLCTVFAASASASVAGPGFFEFTADAPGSLPAETPGFLDDENVTSLSTTFNPTTEQFTFDATLSPDVNGTAVNSFSLVIGTTGSMQNRTGEFALLYFDATREGEPVVSLYTYNGADSATSFRFADFQNEALLGSVAPDTIASSIGSGPDFLNSASVTVAADGSRTFSVDIDASDINDHVPSVPSPTGAEFFGLQVAQELGIWFHTFQQTFETTYTDEGFFIPETGSSNLVSTGFAVASNFNTVDITGLSSTFVAVPEPASMALVAGGLLMVAGRRRRLA